jgi:hypothetical protein
MESLASRKSVSYRIASRDPRPLTVFPVAARIDASASKLRTAWWRGGSARGERVFGYQATFEKLLRELYILDECDLGAYFDATQVPYDSDYSYGEAIAAAIDGTDDKLGIGYACDQLTRRPVEQVAPWERFSDRTSRIDFFVSYAGSDRAWAEWVAWQLTEAGYTVELDAWEWAAGQNFITAMSDALQRADQVIAFFSTAYFNRIGQASDEWTTAALHVPGSRQNRLVPVLVEAVPASQIPAVLRPFMFCDLTGLGADQARRALLDAVSGRLRPAAEPEFPPAGVIAELGRLHGSEPQLPGTLPQIWNIPARNPAFTGREDVLLAICEGLLAGGAFAVQALHGMGGIGKTQLAVEYAHRFASTYSLAWWINADQAALIGDQFAALGIALGCVPDEADTEAARPAVLARLRHQGQWLLVFDGAEDPDDIRPWLPGGGGHVLITSRGRGWAEVAASIEVGALARQESVALLRGRADLDEKEANQIAESLGDLPLAIDLAAGYIAETRIPAGAYVDLLRREASALLDQPDAGPYQLGWPLPSSSRLTGSIERTRPPWNSPTSVHSWPQSGFPRTCSLLIWNTCLANSPSR